MSAETTQPDVLRAPWVAPFDGAEGLLYGIPVAEDPITQPGLPFLEAIPVKTKMPVPLFSSPNTTTDGSPSLGQETRAGEQYPLFVPLQNQYGKGSTETPISDPRALKEVGMNSGQPDGVRHWATRSFWEAYHEKIAHLDELHQTGKVSVEDYPDRFFEINRAFGLDGPSNDNDGRVDIGTGMITDPRARVALTKQEDTDRRVQRDTWRARYRAGAFGNTTFSAGDAGINEAELSPMERQKRREVETAIRGDAYIHRISSDGEPPMYAYKASIDRQHEAAVVDLQHAPERRELAGMPQSARSARAGMPYLAVAQRIVELGDDISTRVPPWIRPVVKGTARATASFAALAVAACSGVIPATFTPEATHIPTPTFPEPTHINPPTIGAPASAVDYGDGIDPASIREAPGVFPGIGGEGEQYLMPMTDALRNNLNAQHYAPVYESGGTAAIVTGYDANGDGVNDVTTCTTATRDQMFSNVDRTQVLLLDHVDNGVAYYSNPNTGEVENKVVTTITLPPLADGRDTMCIQAIVNDPTSPEYTLLYTLVIDESGTVLARLPVFSGNDDVRVEWTDAGTQVKVNNTEYPMEIVSSNVVFATSTPPPTFTPEPSATPDTYGVEVVSDIRADVTLEQYSGVRVQYSFDVDESMKDRARKPIGEVEFFSSDWYKHPNGLSAQEAGAESLMRGIWYAWADDDPNRANVPFEQYMQMVAEYQQGKRPLDDVAFKVFADDLANPGYSPVVTTFDPTTPVRFVLTAKTNNMSEYVLTNAADQQAFGTQKGPNGLELWLNISSDIAGGDRSSYMVTSRVATALLRLTWPAQYQTRQSMPYPVGDFTDVARVHKDIYSVMEYDGPYGRFGAFTIPPEWSDKRGG